MKPSGWGHPSSILGYITSELPLEITIPDALLRRKPDPAERTLFSGREKESAEIRENCALARLTLVTAPPEFGVSTLLRLDVAPELKNSKFIVAVFSDWESRGFAAGLRATVAAAIHDQADGGFNTDFPTLKEIIAAAQAATGRRVVTILDQFEVYLRNHGFGSGGDDFDAELASAINAHEGAFVIGVHDTSLDALAKLGHLIPNLTGHTVTIPALSAESAGEFIRRLADREGYMIEPAAIQSILSAPCISTGSGVRPLMARLAVERLFEAEHRLKSPVARTSNLASNGGAERMVFDSLDTAFNGLSSTHTELLFRWIAMLTTPDGGRLMASDETLVAHAGKWEKFAPQLLEALRNGGVLQTVNTPAGRRLEPARDAIAVILREWWRRREAAIVARERGRFRIRSLSIAAGAITAAYVIYLITTWNKP